MPPDSRRPRLMIGAAHHRPTELARRVAVAVLGLPLAFWAIGAGRRSSAALLAVAGAIGCWEYQRLVAGRLSTSGVLAVAAGAVLPAVPLLVPHDMVGSALFVSVGALSIALWTVNLFRGPRDVAPAAIGHAVAGTLFASVGLVAMATLRASSGGSAWATVVLIAVWANDTCAYLLGRTFGRRRLWPAVSPHKSWEGLFAGAAGGVAATLAARPLCPPGMSAVGALELGLVAAVFGGRPRHAKSASGSRRAMIAKDMVCPRTRAVLVFAIMLSMAAAYATSSPPNPVELWTRINRQPAHELANWGRSNVRGMRLLTRWGSREPEAFRDFVLWTVRNPTEDLNAFQRSQVHGAMFDDIARDRPGNLQSFMGWCRRYPAAAESLVSDPAPLEWIGDHLYRL